MSGVKPKATQRSVRKKEPKKEDEIADQTERQTAEARRLLTEYYSDAIEKYKEYTLYIDKAESFGLRGDVNQERLWAGRAEDIKRELQEAFGEGSKFLYEYIEDFEFIDKDKLVSECLIAFRAAVSAIDGSILWDMETKDAKDADKRKLDAAKEAEEEVRAYEKAEAKKAAALRKAHEEQKKYNLQENERLNKERASYESWWEEALSGKEQAALDAQTEVVKKAIKDYEKYLRL